MPVCPACGTAAEARAQRCSQCGAQLPSEPFTTSTPATRRMGHTMLGVAPSPPQSVGAEASSGQVSPGPPLGEFQPFAPVPGTLTGLKPDTQLEPRSAGSAEETGEDVELEPAPKTLTGLSDPTHAPQPHPGRTLMGFGAWPNAATALAPAAPTAPTAPQENYAKGGPPGGDKHASHTTLMGVSPFGRPVPADAAGATPNPQLKGTLLGVSPIRNLQQPSVPETGTRGFGATLAIPDGPATPPGPHGTEPTVHTTMLGVAPVPNAEVDRDSGRAAMPQGSPTNKGTLLGVAIPGIAPLNPGQAKPSVPLRVAPPVVLQKSETPLVQRATSDGDATREATERARASRTGQQRYLAWVFGTAAALLVLLIVVALGIWWTSVHLAVTVTTSESGNENLVLTCSNCPDSTRASIESKAATFVNHRATIELERRLSIGDNRLTLQIVRPSRTRGETVSVVVPVEFRVTTSVAELTADPPVILVQCEAAPGTTLVVDGQRSSVGPSGQLKVPLNVSTMLMGQAASVLPFERSIAYEVVREGRATTGNLVVRTGITPLELTTPGSMHVTQNATFTLSGRASAKSKLTANGHNIAIASDGSFRQEMALSAPGATQLYLRAEEASLAPRLVEISLERVTNLRQRADELARSLPTDFDSIAALAATKPDSLVALHAEVVAVESAGALTRLVATSNCSRQPCLASIRCTGPLSVRRGSHITAVGKARLTQRPSTNDHDLAIDAALVVEDPEQ